MYTSKYEMFKSQAKGVHKSSQKSGGSWENPLQLQKRYSGYRFHVPGFYGKRMYDNILKENENLYCLGKALSKIVQ